MSFVRSIRPFSRMFRPEAEAPEAVAADADIAPAVIAPSAAAAGGEASADAMAQLQEGSTLRALAIAASSADDSHLATLFDSADSRDIVSLVTEGSSSRIRQYAAQRVTDAAELRHLLKLVRGKDKSVYKIIKQKCDELRTEEQKSVQVETNAAAACASLERHAQRIYDAVYEPTLEHFMARWRTVEPQAPPELQERARRAIERSRETIAEHARRLADLAERQALEEAQRAAQAELLERAREQALEREQTAAAAAAAQAEARQADEQERNAKAAADANAARRLAGLVAKAHAALREGDTGRAAGLRRAIDERAAMPVAPAHLARQVAQLDTKLAELKKWKDFAVAPKRAELIADMEALIGSTESPKVLGERIKQLQDDWKVISKGVVSDSQADWERFHRAADLAYQPCRAYYESLAKQREANLQQRQALLERLKNFETAQKGDNPDWRTMAVVVREAPQEWRRYSQVDRAASAKVQREFDLALGRLQERLQGWYAQNKAEKQSLIERAKQLRALADNRSAVDAAKRLQQLWKQVGVVEREEEQSLWNEFREQCDAVFSTRLKAQAEFGAALEANKAAATALCEEIERAAALSGHDLFAAAAKAAQWRSDFAAIGELPRAEQRALEARFEKALKACQTRVAAVRERDKQQSFDRLLDAARHIQAYGYAVAQRAPDAEKDALKQAAETFIASVEHWPKGAAPLLKEAWQQAETAVAGEMAANEKAYRSLCVRREIAGDRPTPPEDQPLRREFQMQRLMQRMGQGSEQSDIWEALALEWVRIGPIADAEYRTLLARFMNAR
jgi:hypothetical protein